MAVLGYKHWYRYDSDDTKSYKIKMLDYLAEAAGLELDDTLPELPRGYTPRFFWLQELEPNNPGQPIRKKLIVKRSDVPRFSQGQKIEVAGIKMKTMGFNGECRRGGRNNNPVISKVRVELSNDQIEGQ